MYQVLIAPKIAVAVASKEIDAVMSTGISSVMMKGMGPTWKSTRVTSCAMLSTLSTPFDHCACAVAVSTKAPLIVMFLYPTASFLSVQS